MKKILSITLMAVLLVGATLSVSAETKILDDSTTSASANVNVQLTDEDGSVLTLDKVYNVEVVFDELTFKYQAAVSNDGTKAVWDPSSHTYTVGENGTDISFSTPADQSIVVKNHSNAEVGVTANFVGDSKTSAIKNGVNSTISNNDTTLASAALGASYNNVGAAPSTTYTVGMEGTPTMDELTFLVDTITVTITP